MRLALCALLTLAALASPAHADDVHELAVAAFLGDAAKVQALLKPGVDINALDGKYGCTPLAAAANNGQAETARFLLEHGADPNIRDTKGMAPIMHAITAGNAAVVEALLAHGADPDAWHEGGVTPLMLAAGQGDLAIFKTLLAHGADPGAQDGHRLTAATTAQSMGHKDVVELLSQAKAPARPQEDCNGAASRVLHLYASEDWGGLHYRNLLETTGQAEGVCNKRTDHISKGDPQFKALLKDLKQRCWSKWMELGEDNIPGQSNRLSDQACRLKAAVLVNSLVSGI
jgi:hypothetical protein